ncbi:MAG: CAP domain-containing protein [Phycisphaerae bacterium]
MRTNIERGGAPAANAWVAVISAVALVLVLGGCPQPSSSPVTPFGLVPPDPFLTSGGISTTAGGTTPTTSEDRTVVGGVSNDGAVGIANILASDFPTCRSVANADLLRDQILQRVNWERSAAGLNPVRRNATLEAQAEQYACEMIHYDFFAHDNPATGSTLRDRAEQFGYNYLTIGENLAGGQETAQEAMDGWMNSPGHRANILNPDFEELGVGIRAGGDYGMYWVQEFGKPAAVRIPASGS